VITFSESWFDPHVPLSGFFLFSSTDERLIRLLLLLCRSGLGIKEEERGIENEEEVEEVEEIEEDEPEDELDEEFDAELDEGEAKVEEAVKVDDDEEDEEGEEEVKGGAIGEGRGAR
jgi:hypothetical protein